MSTACGHAQGGGDQSHVDTCGQWEEAKTFLVNHINGWMTPKLIIFLWPSCWTTTNSNNKIFV